MTLQDLAALQGMELRDRHGQTIGRIADIYADSRTGQPEWALVETGPSGTKRTFVPLHGAGTERDHARVPYDRDHVNEAPAIEPEGALSADEERRLYDHYGIAWAPPEGERRERPFAPGSEATGRDDAMTRSEEELVVGTSRREAGRARLRKWVVTDTETHTVPVRREEVRVVREPITDDNIEQAMQGPDIGEAEHEVVLSEEEPVVEKRTVPKERVRLTKETETGEEEVRDTVRKERIEVETEPGTDRP